MNNGMRFDAWRDQLEDDELTFAARLEGMPEQMRVAWLAVEFYRLRKAVEGGTQSRRGQVVGSALGTGVGGVLLIAAAIAARMLGYIPGG